MGGRVNQRVATEAYLQPQNFFHSASESFISILSIWSTEFAQDEEDPGKSASIKDTSSGDGNDQQQFRAQFRAKMRQKYLNK